MSNVKKETAKIKNEDLKVTIEDENEGVKTSEIDVKDTALQEALKLIEELKSKIDNQPQTPQFIIQKENSYISKKIKCINLMHNPVNISTEPDGMGRVYSFEKYGDVRLIKFDDLSDIVASYPNTMENGLVYIADSEVVESYGLSENYQEIYTKDMIDKIIYLREESDVDLFIGMNSELKKSTALEIARNYNNNEKFDLNYLDKIKKETNFDIVKIAEDIKQENTEK